MSFGATVKLVLGEWYGDIYMWKSGMMVPVPKARSKGAILQDRRVPWHILGLSGVQGNVFDYSGKACECGRRKAIIGRGARWL